MASIKQKIAIIGVGVRLPGGVRSSEDLWDVLINGVDAVTEIPAHRWDQNRFLHGLRSAPGKSITFSAGVIDDIDYFDCNFFGISEREAQSMDPQQRLSLELTWEMFENANLKPSAISGTNTSVYMGASSMDAALSCSDDPWVMGPFSMTGNSLSIVSNRLSFYYDLQGPSLTLDTACSSSLVAVHEACKFLAQDGGEYAVAGGVNSLYSPFPYVGFSKAQMLAEHGRCKVFDQEGNGYVRSEGGVIYLLKRLEDAERDGNVIHAVIIAAGSNSDGMTWPGMSFPNMEGQKRLLVEVYGEEGFDPNSLSYFEAHGTGTAAGDPAEVGSVGAVLGAKRPKDTPLLVGSIKSSIGHLEPASGVAGMLKSILILKNKVIPPNIHLKQPLDTIDFEGLNIEPVKDAVPLPEVDGPARIGVNSFGFGGTNAHALLEEYIPEVKSFEPAVTTAVNELPPLFLSARSAASLQEMAGELGRQIAEGDDFSYASLAAGIVSHRELMEQKLVVTGASVQEVAEALESYASGEKHASLISGQSGEGMNKVAFAFSGNGAQWDGMGYAFYQENSVFRETVDEMDKVLSPMLGWSLSERFQMEKDQDVHLTEVSQPMLLAYQIGLVNVLESVGIVPDMVYGHSVGEVTAAYVAGALDLKQVCDVIYHRSLMQAQIKGYGRMAVAKFSLEDAMPLPPVARGDVEIAAHNSPLFLTLSGDEDSLLEVMESVKKQGGVFRMLQLDYPFHSHFMDPVEDELKQRLAGLKPSDTTIPFISTVSGKEAKGTTLGVDYWWHNIRDQVWFHEATVCALEMGANVFLEIGPNSVLGRFITGTLKDAGKTGSVLPTMRRNKDGADEFSKAWKSAFVNGASVDFTKHFSLDSVTTSLPGYRWDKVDVSMKSSAKSLGLLKKTSSHPLLGFRKDGDLHVWENSLDTVMHPYLADHEIFGDVILPGAAMIEMALAAGTEVFDQVEQEVVDMALVRPLPLATSPAMDVRFSMSPGDGSFRLESKPLLSSEQWTLNAMGRLALKVDSGVSNAVLDLSNIDSFGEPVDMGMIYSEAVTTGLRFGPQFRPVVGAWISDTKAVVELDGETRMESESIVFDPCLLDGAFHSLLALIPVAAGEVLSDAFLPGWFGRVSLIRPGIIKYAVANLERLTSHSAIASFELLNDVGEVLGCLQECRFIRMRGRDAATKSQRAFFVDYLPIDHPKKVGSPPFASCKELASQVSRDLDDLAQEFQRDIYYGELRPLCMAAILSHLHSLLKGAVPSGVCFSIDDVQALGAVGEDMLPYVVYLLKFMESYDLATYQDGRWSLDLTTDLPSAESVWRSIAGDNPAYLPELVVLGRLGMHLVNVLRGKRSVEDILSNEPGGLLEAFYTQSPSARFQNSHIAIIVEQLRSQLPKGRPLRILEVGTGDGGAFKALLEAISSEQLKYCCTDKDNDVLEQIKASNPDLRHVTYQCLDIEEELPDEMELGCYDVIIASHVLHELDHVGSALQNCKQLLAENGIFLTVERNPDPLIDIFLGIDSDWWKHSPSVTEPVSRLVPENVWEDLFEEAGFDDVCTFTEKGVEHPESYIVLARNPLSSNVCEAVEVDPEDRPLWVIVEDVAPTQPAEMTRKGIVGRLEDAGEEVFSLPVATGGAEDSCPEGIDYADGEAWKLALKQLKKACKPLKIVHLAGFDTAPEGKDYAALLTTRTTSLLMFAKACDALQFEADFWLVSGGALGGGSLNLDAVPSQAGAWGAARVMLNEVRTLTPRMIDLHCDMPSEELLDDLVGEIMSPALATEIILNGEQRLIPRLVPLDRLLFENDPHTEQLARISLTFDTPGKLDNLYWKQEMERMPESDEVLIRVRSTGLNFRDVMFSMGMLPPEALEDGLSGPVLGLECSGEVAAIGNDVTDFQVGDEVMCMAGPCFDSQLCVKTDYVFSKPESLTFEEAATIPAAFSTAYYSLKILGNVQPGDKVLIHSAAGGVGLAAIQVAKYLGAEIYATSGTEEKRDFLKLLGVKHVMDSRSLSFYDRVLELTDGEGVDVVLNSLAGEALFKSLKLVKPFGRFLELGKRDFYSNSPLRMRMLRKNVTFFGIDLDEFMACKPKQARQIFQDLIELFESGDFRPLVHSVFNRSNAVNAFKAMQRGKHIGKLVVNFDELHNGVRTLPKYRYKGSVDMEGTYLVTGGLSGLGLATTKRLVRNGAKNIVIMSRSGASSDSAKAGLAELEAAGASVALANADVGDEAQMAAALSQALETMPPLKGVIHSAAVLNDCMISSMTPEMIYIALRAKAVGAWNLHAFTREMDLDFFIMYSSATTVLGNPGQSNYVAANMALEALCQHRRANGLPATTYGWGAISDTGMLTDNPDVMNILKKVMAVVELKSDKALDYMEFAPDDQYSTLFYFNLDWNRARDLKYLDTTMFNWIDELSGSKAASTVSADSAKAILAMERDEAINTLVKAIGIEVAAMLKMPFEKMDTKASIVELGLDSLMAVELGLLIEERYGVRVSSFSMNVNSDLVALSERIYEALLSGGDEDEAAEVAKIMKEKHGIVANSDKVAKIMDEVDVAVSGGAN